MQVGAVIQIRAGNRQMVPVVSRCGLTFDSSALSLEGSENN